MCDLISRPQRYSLGITFFVLPKLGREDCGLIPLHSRKPCPEGRPILQVPHVLWLLTVLVVQPVDKVVLCLFGCFESHLHCFFKETF